MVSCGLRRALGLGKTCKAKCLERTAGVPELNQLGLFPQIDIVDLRCELVEHNYLACRACLRKCADLLEGHISDSVIIENKVDVEAVITLELVVYKGEVT